MKIKFITKLDHPLKKIADGFDQNLFSYLTPPGARVEIKRFDGCKKGDEVHLVIHQPGMKLKWVSLITESKSEESEWSFVDEGKVLPWPLIYWHHHHQVLKVSESSCEIIDDITYKTIPGLNALVYPFLYASFAIRPKRYKKYFNGET